MIFNFRSLLPLVLAAVATIGTAHADSFTATVYNNASGNVVNPATLGTALGTFTTNNINFSVLTPGLTSGSAGFTIGDFLSSGSGVTISSGLASHTVGSTEFVINGAANLVNGQSYTFVHDDGMYLAIDGVYPGVIVSTAQTVAIPSTFTFAGATGLHNFTLYYASNSLSPSVLTGPFTAATPEPSSIVLLGSGLLGLAGAVRRRVRL